jgi:hypothetical protein
MNMRNFRLPTFCISLSLVLGVLTPAAAQSAKDLVGTWVATSNVSEQNGAKSNPYGDPPLGVLLSGADGHYGLVLSRHPAG